MLPKAVASFTDALPLFNKAQKEMNNFSFIPVPPPPKVNYCITGALSVSRSELIPYLDNFSWSFSNLVSKHTDYLILGDLENKDTTTKLTKAKKLNTNIITEENLKEYLS